MQTIFSREFPREIPKRYFYERFSKIDFRELSKKDSKESFPKDILKRDVQETFPRDNSKRVCRERSPGNTSKGFPREISKIVVQDSSYIGDSHEMFPREMSKTDLQEIFPRAFHQERSPNNFQERVPREIPKREISKREFQLSFPREIS